MHTAALLLALLPAAAPEGFSPIFDGETLAGWQGLVGNPITRATMTAEALAASQRDADEQMRLHWSVEDGEIVSDGKGPHLCTARQYGDFELHIDWKIQPGADSGVYLRGAPQVQIWDPVHGNEAARVGSGGLYNNKVNLSRPLALADNPAGTWNTFRIRMVGELVTVFLNDILVVDGVPMENYWDRTRPIYPRGAIELQTHGREVRFRNVFIREIPPEEASAWLHARPPAGFTPIFNGHDLDGWTGSTDGYIVEDGILACDPARGGMLFTDAEYGDFIVRFEFRLPPGGNNGLAIRTPVAGDPAYSGMEIQILDDSAEKFANLQPYQYHGSVYGIVPAQRGYQRAVGEWNFEEVVCRGSRVTVRLNGTTIVDADVTAGETTMDGREHPGRLRTRGHIGLMGHGDRVEFRNLRVLGQ